MGDIMGIENTVLGGISALDSALALAAGAVLAKFLTGKISPMPLQTMRSWFGGIFLIIVCLVVGRASQWTYIPLIAMGMMTLSAFIGISVGDTFYLKTLSLTEASKAFPAIKSSQILSSMLIAGLFLGEKATVSMAIGAILILSGVYLAALSNTGVRRNSNTEPTSWKKWLPLAFTVGMCWALAFCLMKVVFKEVDPLVANSVRLPIASLALTSFMLGTGKGEKLRLIKHGRSTQLLVIVSGILGYGIGVMLSLYAVHYVGVSRAAILTSITPLLVLCLSVLFLKEKLTLRLGLGTVMCTGGIMLLMLF